MGVTSSKQKASNVTLISSSSTADVMSSSSTADVSSSSSTADELAPSQDSAATTPARGKVLPFDPRSPAETFARTPITVGPSSSNNRDTSTPAAAPVKVLEVDPRSPSQQVSRTPIVVGSPSSSTMSTNTSSAQDSSLTAAGATTAKSSLANICTASDRGDDENDDPRSPTVRVPRTPLEDKQFGVSDDPSGTAINKRLFFNQSTAEDSMNISNSEDISDESEQQDSSSGGAAPSPRKPLSNVSNATRGTPRALLQAKQCRTLEEEFTKNQKVILSQLVQDDENVAPVPSQTQFVEQI